MDHNYVPVAQPTEWPITMDDDAWSKADPASTSDNAPYTTNSQNRGGLA